MAENGKQTSVTVDDEHKWGKLIDLRIGAEFDADILGDNWVGYILKITGGMDKQGFAKHSNRIGKADKMDKVEVDRFDVCRYVVKRPTKEVDGKSFYKAPKVQRLITAKRVRRKLLKKQRKVEKVKENQKKFQEYLAKVNAK